MSPSPLDTSAPKSSGDRVKDVVVPLIVPIITAVLGFGFGVAQDILKHEYEFRENAIRVQYVELIKPPVHSGSKYTQEISTTIHPIGKKEVPLTVITATANQDVRLTDDEPRSAPFSQRANLRQVESEGGEDSYRTLTIRDFHEPQSVTWTVTAESLVEPKGQLAFFNYEKPSDARSQAEIPWTEKISPVMVAAILLLYSAVATLMALIYRWKGRRKI